VHKIGVPPGTRTPTNGFGDRSTAIILGIHCLAGKPGLEPGTFRLTAERSTN